MPGLDALAAMTDAERKAAWEEPAWVGTFTERLLRNGYVKVRHSRDTCRSLYTSRAVGIAARWEPWNACAVYELILETEPQELLSGDLGPVVYKVDASAYTWPGKARRA